MNFNFHQSQGVQLKSIVNTIGEDGLQLMAEMLAWSPEKRPTASNCLRHKYFEVGQKLGAPIISQPATSAVRKNSSDSTQSDSKLVLAKRVNAKLTQKVVPTKDVPMDGLMDNPLAGLEDELAEAEKGGKGGTDKVTTEQQQKEQRGDNSMTEGGTKTTDVPMRGPDRNRNLSLSKGSLGVEGLAGLLMDTAKKSTKVPYEEKTDESTQKGQTQIGTSNEGDEGAKEGKTNGRSISGKKTTAKEHYLSKSRYMPGLRSNGSSSLSAGINRKAIAQPSQQSGAKQTTGGGILSSVQARFEYAYGYVPSFGAPRQQPPNANSNANSLGNSSSSISIGGGPTNNAKTNNAFSTIGGRTNWAAKYQRN
ncbi:hypothetical protein niasHS_007360 [Heterodera schachtii]|uniref:Uncharacterized protein n=1 Tax=Heterodera schachtii TaxID=97005 RepID=A0ABD2JKA7_HETSC